MLAYCLVCSVIHINLTINFLSQYFPKLEQIIFSLDLLKFIGSHKNADEKYISEATL